MRRIVGLAAAGALCLGCSGGGGGTTLADAGLPDGAKARLTVSLREFLTVEESDCVADAVFASDVTSDDLLSFAATPTPSDPVNELFADAFIHCVDPDAPLPVISLADDGHGSRDFYRSFFDLTDAQTTCLLDALTDHGIGRRQIMIGHAFPEIGVAIADGTTAALSSCLP